MDHSQLTKRWTPIKIKRGKTFLRDLSGELRLKSYIFFYLNLVYFKITLSILYIWFRNTLESNYNSSMTWYLMVPCGMRYR